MLETFLTVTDEKFTQMEKSLSCLNLMCISHIQFCGRAAYEQKKM